MSTRVLYGNFKFRPPFPQLRALTRTAEADLAALDAGVWAATRYGPAASATARSTVSYTKSGSPEASPPTCCRSW
ncbi:hypothetical protein GCM10022251_31120 [Phytohabitans flavus]|uniref:Uncharacterized protein n=1 Tax=Phytohabitans flavus TaxID=1076124 RepID=A0A6F8XWV5_9ACTN|nr:hypothetical protein [Phytohabitans flavus]BCB78293.1 hypothetical protein Pflav_047030 [Phytohabitans flavus]